MSWSGAEAVALWNCQHLASDNFGREKVYLFFFCLVTLPTLVTLLTLVASLTVLYLCQEMAVEILEEEISYSFLERSLLATLTGSVVSVMSTLSECQNQADEYEGLAKTYSLGSSIC